MAAGDRKNNGKPKDIVRHFSKISGGEPACLTKGYGYSTNDIYDVTCIKCKRKIIQDERKYSHAA